MSEKEPMPASHDCGGDAAAYLLGALEPAEADAFRTHLQECAVCRDEVEALEGVVQALPMAAPAQIPPRRLRRRLMRAIREQPRLGAQPPLRHRATSLRWGVRPAFAAVAGAAVVAGGVIAGVELSDSGASGQVIQARVAGVSGSAQLRVSAGRGELIVRHLSAPPPGHVYEVWLKAPGSPPVPASVLFSVTASGNADVGLPRSLRGISQVMVTAEPDGGTRAPTSSPVIVAQLS